jgi:hypothetical protein
MYLRRENIQNDFHRSYKAMRPNKFPKGKSSLEPKYYNRSIIFFKTTGTPAAQEHHNCVKNLCRRETRHTGKFIQGRAYRKGPK